MTIRSAPCLSPGLLGKANAGMSHPQKTPQGCQEKEGLEAQAGLRNCWETGSQWPQARVLAERALQTGINRNFALGKTKNSIHVKNSYRHITKPLKNQFSEEK